MTATVRQRPWLRGVGAIVLSFAVCSALSFATDGVLHAIGVFPPLGEPMAGGLFGVALSYRLIYNTGSTWLVARLAPEPRWRYVWITGGIGFVLSLLGLLATKDKGPEFGPLWYPLALAASVPLTTWLGGWLCLRPHAR